ncbi:hypothetical protein HPB48_017580 [Haemaphysalis longicornis]|uniref:CCHC-type domain-containing protein n=1 Tax=Haemaphysalis longicornis TaxID=44386 RepID=A0A9J6GVQ4_HAELO|nr:hypothetical protein HPB48_017580 [Haemaphysalis longicornis]
MDYKPPIRKKCYKCYQTGHLAKDSKQADYWCYSRNGTSHISTKLPPRIGRNVLLQRRKMRHVARECKHQECAYHLYHKQDNIFRDGEQDEQRSGFGVSPQWYLSDELDHFFEEWLKSPRDDRKCYICGHIRHFCRDCSEVCGNDPVANIYYH